MLDLHQDRQGFLWVGTHAATTAYRFKAHRHDPEDPGSISNSFVWRIHEDRAGNLWLGTRGGLNRFDRHAERFIRYRHDPEAKDSLSHDVVSDVHQDQSGALWVATMEGLNRFARGAPETGPPAARTSSSGTAFPPTCRPPTPTRHASSRSLGLFQRLDPEATEGTGTGLALVKRIVEVHGGRIWVESEGDGRGSTFCLTL